MCAFDGVAGNCFVFPWGVKQDNVREGHCCSRTFSSGYKGGPLLSLKNYNQYPLCTNNCSARLSASRSLLLTHTTFLSQYIAIFQQCQQLHATLSFSSRKARRIVHSLTVDLFQGPNALSDVSSAYGRLLLALRANTNAFHASKRTSSLSPQTDAALCSRNHATTEHY